MMCCAEPAKVPRHVVGLAPKCRKPAASAYAPGGISDARNAVGTLRASAKRAHRSASPVCRSDRGSPHPPSTTRHFVTSCQSVPRTSALLFSSSALPFLTMEAADVTASDNSGTSQPSQREGGQNARVRFECVPSDFFPPSENVHVHADRWRKVRLFFSAILSEPALNVFGGCDLVEVQLLGHALANGVPSAEWLGMASCVRNVIFVWQFLLLVRRRLDQSTSLAKAVGELIIFCAGRGAAATDVWESKATAEAKEYREMWQETSAEQYAAWLLSRGVQPAVNRIVGDEAVQDRLRQQAEEERTGQAWPGREPVRPYPEDQTAVRERRRAASRRTRRPARPVARRPHRRRNSRLATRQRCTWDADSCRHNYPKSLIRGPGVLTFMCGCGYIIGFELLRETESPAHVVSALTQRFVRMPRVVYCDTACQTQRNALRRIPWLVNEEDVAFFIDRFHQCGHVCSPVFEADEYPDISRGHDTSGAERQHSIKKKSKASLTFLSQHRFIVRSRYMAAYNNIRVSQKRLAKLEGLVARVEGAPIVPREVQHQPVETYYHKNIVHRCEVRQCACRAHLPPGPAPGLEKKI